MLRWHWSVETSRPESASDCGTGPVWIPGQYGPRRRRSLGGEEQTKIRLISRRAASHRSDAQQQQQQQAME